jgi:uncharacterized delta-60 repeat protein
MVGRVLGSVVAIAAVCALVAAPAAGASAGGLDPSFGVGGIATTPLESASRLTVKLAVGPEGEAVVGDPGGYLVRFGPSGALDPAFGEAGKLAPAVSLPGAGPGHSLKLGSFVIDGAGRLVMFGAETDSAHQYPIPFTTENQTATESEAVVLRLDPEGRLDPSFGAGTGFVRSSFGLRSGLGAKFPLTAAIAGAVDAKGRPLLVVGGAAIGLGCHAGAVTDYPLGLVRLSAPGGLDNSFGAGGVAPITGSTEAVGLGLDAAGRPALGLGRYLHPTAACHPGTALARLSARGGRLTGFGSRGTATLRRNLGFRFVTPSGAIVLSRLDGRTLEVVRVGLSGRPDKGFGDDGTAKVRLPVAAGAHVAPVGVDAQGRIVLAGVVGRNGAYPVLASKIARPPTFAAARLLPDGRLDRSVGKAGWILDPVPGGDELGATTAALDRQGRVLIAATITAPGSSEGGYMLARLLPGKVEASAPELRPSDRFELDREIKGHHPLLLFERRVPLAFEAGYAYRDSSGPRPSVCAAVGAITAHTGGAFFVHSGGCAPLWPSAHSTRPPLAGYRMEGSLRGGREGAEDFGFLVTAPDVRRVRLEDSEGHRRSARTRSVNAAAARRAHLPEFGFAEYRFPSATCIRKVEVLDAKGAVLGLAEYPICKR